MPDDKTKRGRKQDARQVNRRQKHELSSHAGKSPDVAERSPVALPGQGELPSNLERDMRRLLPGDWLDWTPDRGPQ